MSESPEKTNGDQSISKVEKQLNIDPKILSGLNKEKKEALLSYIVQIKKTHVGPIPDPETLKEYSDIIPNGAERIMSMAEKQSDHRMAMEKRVISSQMNQSNLGQIFALIIGLAAISGGTCCIMYGHEISGSLFGLGGLTGLVTAFIKGKGAQRRELEEKRPTVKVKPKSSR